MLRRKLVVGLIAGPVVAAAAVVAIAAEGGTGHSLKDTALGRLISGCVGRMMVLRSELDLSEPQRQQIRTILTSHRQEIQKQAEAVWQKRTALRNKVLSPGSDEQEIRKAANDMAQQIGDAAVLASKLRNEIAPLLNETQQKRIQKYFAENGEAVEKFFANASKAE